jgi:hypothetical protein
VRFYTLLAEGSAWSRLFSQWSMGYLDRETSVPHHETHTLLQIQDLALKSNAQLTTQAIQVLLNLFQKDCRELTSELGTELPK